MAWIGPWQLLFAAIVLEIAATSLLNASQGMTRAGYGLAAAIGYGFCFWLLSLAMVRIPMGIAYAIWSGVGITALAVIGWLVFRQQLGLVQLGFIALILVGVIGLNLSTGRG